MVEAVTARARFLIDDRLMLCCWHDGEVKFRVLVVGVTMSMIGTGCGGMATPHPAVPDTSATAAAPGVTDNHFIPADQNLSTCVSSLPRPNCGTEAQGGWRQGLTFGVLMLGMAFIGWRIFRAVRRGERGSSPAR